MVVVLAFFDITFPLLFFIAYSSFRYFVPATKWDIVREFLSTEGRPYCRSCELVFDEGAAVPAPNSRTMTSVAPHGILCMGWSFMVGSDTYASSNAKWLVAAAMMNLPVLGDLMRWTGCDSADVGNMKKIMKTGTNVGLIPGAIARCHVLH